MPDDKSKRGGQDRTRIDVSEAYELRHWTKTLGVSEDELKAAVNKVDDRAAAVAIYLKATSKQAT